MLRTAAATALLGWALALGLASTHVVPGTTWSLVARYWPVVMLTGGVAGLIVGTGHGHDRLVPAGVLVVGAILLAGHLVGAPVRSLLLAGLLAWAGVLVAIGDRPGRPGHHRTDWW